MTINVNRLLRDYIESRQLSKAEFARKADVSDQAIHNYCKPLKPTKPTQRILDKIFIAHPDFYQLYLEKARSVGGAQMVVRDIAVEYQTRNVREMISELEEEVRDMRSKISLKEQVIRTLKDLIEDPDGEKAKE